MIPILGTNRGVWFPRLWNWKPIHLLKRLETASQQLTAKHEGLSLQGSSHITKLDRNHLERQDPGHFVPAAGIWVGDRIVTGSWPQIPSQPCKLAQQNGLLLPSQPPQPFLSLHSVFTSSHYATVWDQDCCRGKIYSHQPGNPTPAFLFSV